MFGRVGSVHHQTAPFPIKQRRMRKCSNRKAGNLGVDTLRRKEVLRKSEVKSLGFDVAKGAFDHGIFYGVLGFLAFTVLD